MCILRVHQPCDDVEVVETADEASNVEQREESFVAELTYRHR